MMEKKNERQLWQMKCPRCGMGYSVESIGPSYPTEYERCPSGCGYMGRFDDFVVKKIEPTISGSYIVEHSS
jgi:hypothetical protein